MTDPSSRNIVWITGASSGIGRALALRIARDGWTVAATARSQDDLDTLADEAGPVTGRIVAFPGDVADDNAMRDLVARMEFELGPIDLAVLNAGTHQPVSALELEPGDFRKLIEINFLGTVNCLAALVPGMAARHSGQIALVGSVAGYCGLPTSAAYGASKAALINMAEALKPELDAAGIRLQLVNPGFVRTPLTDRNQFPMPFLMEVDDAAEAFWRGLQSNRFEIVFPRRLGWILKLMRLLPYPLFFGATRRMVPGN